VNRSYAAPSSITLCPVRSAALVAFMLLVLVAPKVGHASQTLTMQDGPASVRFDESQDAAATEVLRLFPRVRSDLQRLIPWPVDFHPTLVLIKEGALERMTGTGLVVALAIPERNLVLLDLSRMARHAFVLETTMKHELCHLLLHRHIRNDLLPKWLDEGVCQWASNGMAEIIMDRKISFLEEAVLAGRLLSFPDLAGQFPDDERGLILAYEQSQSIVNYMSQVYGNEKLLLVLNRLRNGKALPEAVRACLGVTFAELESGWKNSLKREHTWLTYVSVHIYEILFFVAALLTIGGSVKLIVRRKRRRTEEDEADSP
jgi:hypothetical protein